MANLLFPGTELNKTLSLTINLQTLKMRIHNKQSNKIYFVNIRNLKMVEYLVIFERPEKFEALQFYPRFLLLGANVGAIFNFWVLK